VDLESLPITLLADAPNFLLAQDVKDVILALQAQGGAEVVVVDPLAQVAPGANREPGRGHGQGPPRTAGRSTSTPARS
jgi:hypothetical protein